MEHAGSNAKLYTPDSKMMREMKDQNQNIQVFVRVRPMNTLERSKNSLVVLDTPGSREVVVKERTVNNVTKTFTFDRVFGPNSKQVDVYKSVVAPLVEQVLLGYNCTVFAYGQTGTGKTFTMEGERSPEVRGEVKTWESDPLSGIVPRALSHLFDELRLQNAEFTVRVSHLELYNEELFDLLGAGDDTTLRTLRLYEDASRKGSVIIQGLEEVTVQNKQEVYSIMERGSIRRRTAATQMNATSSRSHTVFSLTVHIKESNMEGEELVKIGKLNLVDLAGSENIGRSGAIDKRAREAGSINQSLLTLGRVITALVERTPHVPYRESKLTRILQDSLGGRTKTSIIATVSPASYNSEETLSTLDYAHRAKNITNRPEINQKLTRKAVLKAYTEEIERLRRDLAATREKNGVYMDKENYDTLTSKVDCQNQDLSEKIAQVKSLQDDMEKKDEEVNLFKKQWEETKDDLIAANQIIEDLRQKLSNTERKLQDTEHQRDQQEHLVEKHVKTEQQLTNEAAQLMQTTEESTSSLEKLYRKLERKKAVEQSNFDAGRRFNDDLGNQFSLMCLSLEKFRVDHASFCGVQRMKMDTFLQEKEDQFVALGNQLEKFFKFATNSLGLAKKKITKQMESSESWSKSVETEVNTISSEAILHVEEWKEKTCQDLYNKINTELKSLFGLMEGLGSSFKTHISAQGSLLNDYVTARVQKLEGNRHIVEKFLDDQVLANDQVLVCAGQAEAFTAEYVKTIENASNTMMVEFQRLVQSANTFRMALAENSQTQTRSLLKSMTQLQDFSTEIHREFDINKVETELLRNNSLNNAKQTESDIVSELLKCKKNYQEGLESVANLQRTIQNQVLNQKEAWLKTQKYIVHEDVAHRKQLETFGKEFKEITEDIKNHGTEQVKEILDTMHTHQVVNATFIEDERNEMSEHCNDTSTFVDETRDVVLQQTGKLEEFWESTYVLDCPTGQTPQKKTYEYPKNLSATSPHERILNRYIRPTKPADSNELF